MIQDDYLTKQSICIPKELIVRKNMHSLNVKEHNFKFSGKEGEKIDILKSSPIKNFGLAKSQFLSQQVTPIIKPKILNHKKQKLIQQFTNEGRDDFLSTRFQTQAPISPTTQSNFSITDNFTPKNKIKLKKKISSIDQLCKVSKQKHSKKNLDPFENNEKFSQKNFKLSRKCQTSRQKKNKNKDQDLTSKNYKTERPLQSASNKKHIPHHSQYLFDLHETPDQLLYMKGRSIDEQIDQYFNSTFQEDQKSAKIQEKKKKKNKELVSQNIVIPSITQSKMTIKPASTQKKNIIIISIVISIAISLIFLQLLK